MNALERLFESMFAIIREGEWTKRTQAHVRDMFEHTRALTQPEQKALVGLLQGMLHDIAKQMRVVTSYQKETERPAEECPAPKLSDGPPALKKKCPTCGAPPDEACVGMTIVVYGGELRPRPDAPYFGLFAFHDARCAPDDMETLRKQFGLQ